MSVTWIYYPVVGPVPVGKHLKILNIYLDLYW